MELAVSVRMCVHLALISLLAKVILPLLNFTELSYEAEMYSHHGGRGKHGWDKGEEKDLALEAATEHPQTWRSWSCQAGGTHLYRASASSQPFYCMCPRGGERRQGQRLVTKGMTALFSLCLFT